MRYILLSTTLLMAGCAGQQPYGSLASASLPDRSYVTSRKTACGPDRHVCWEMTRDDTDRRAAGGN